ncbi:ABC transporter ATP-binding protein [Streptococcus cuniculipharyngis]|uniref:ABC transporter ATP-binding protein n=1 Tax=Streptococcus cuniculipharyngis TaxID=1562651 RepID=A0A5C5SAT0_9STRE|nr:ABC transporter ATP-binding protein [Streptococcus cuniculipharyngis]TWS96901.1 ABC transporter ATP-binding protein [Streptococcus cuniculipharyngis]
MTTLLRFNHVTKAYGGSRVLDDFNLDLAEGKIVGLLGPNGSGKTTLIKLVNGLLQPDQGEVLIAGHHPSVATKKLVSYLPDTSYLRDYLKVREIISLFADFYADFDRQRAESLLSDLAIDDTQYLKNLSKGDKEKVQLILVMSRKAKLYVLDEPIAGVDPATRDYILRTIISNYSEDSSVLISTHLIADVEPVLDQVVLLDQGKLILQGETDDLRQEYGKSIDGIFRDRFRV